MAKTTHGLPETKGFFRVRGITTGTKREDSFKSHTFPSGAVKNTAKFGLKTNADSTVYVNVEGFKTAKAYLFKKSEVKGQKGEQKVVAWDERYDHEDNGFKVIGVRLGLEKDEKGKNVINTYTQYDAVDQLEKDLGDDVSVYIQGQIDYSSFKNREGDAIRSKKLLADAIFLNKEDIDFEADNFEPLSDFKQRIVYTGIEKVEDKFAVEAKIITNNSIENAEFVIYDKNLANLFKKNLKPYTAIDVNGQIISKVDTEEVEETNVWGQTNSFDKVNKSMIREYVIVGANPDSIDNETYTEGIIEEAVAKLASEGQQKAQNKANDNGGWGKTDNKPVGVAEDELPW